MWKRLRIKNFQGHAALSLAFGPGVTTIVGPTDAGKSAVVRALRWVCLNRPNGSSMVRHGTPAASVLLVTDEHKVTRGKGKGTNVYALDGRKLVAFKSDVPAPVLDVLQVTPANFQRQFDPPFWLTLPPRDLSKRLNEITGLDAAETVKTKLQAKAKRTAAELRVLAEQQKAIKRSLRRLSRFFPLMKADARANRAATIAAETARSFDVLSRLVETARAAQKAKDTASALAAALAATIATSEKARAATTKYDRLAALIRDAKAATLSCLPALTAAFQKWDAARVASAHAYARCGTLEYHLDEYTKEDRLWRKANRKLQKVPACPTCGSPLTKTPSLPS